MLTKEDRKRLLESSLKEEYELSEDATALWNSIFTDLMEIPFDDVCVTYDEFANEIFFIVFHFPKDYIVNATFYIDGDDSVYFSIISEKPVKDVLVVDALPKDIFLKKMKEIWMDFIENKS